MYQEDQINEKPNRAAMEELFNKKAIQPKKAGYVSRSFEMDARRGFEDEEEIPEQGDMYYDDEEMDVDDEGNFEMANIDREIDKQDRLYMSLKAQAEAGGHEHEAAHRHSEIEEKDEIDYYENDPINYNRIMENLDEVPGHEHEAQEGDEQHDEYEDQEGYGEDPNEQHGIVDNFSLFNFVFVADQDIQQRIMAIMQQQQHHQDEEMQHEEEEAHEGQLYEEEEYQNYTAYENHQQQLARKAGSASRKKPSGKKQKAKVRPLNPPANKKEPIYSQTVGYKTKGASSKGTKSQKSKDQTHIDRNQQYQHNLAHNNHIVNMGYGEGIQEVDEDPASENEIMPKISDSQGDEEQISGKDYQIYDVLSDNVQKAKQNLRNVPKNEVEILILRIPYNNLCCNFRKVFNKLILTKLILTTTSKDIRQP